MGRLNQSRVRAYYSEASFFKPSGFLKKLIARRNWKKTILLADKQQGALQAQTHIAKQS